MRAGAARLGLQAQFFSTPTSILAALGAVPDQRTFLIRTYPGTMDLGKLGELDADLGSFIGAFTAAAVSNLFARVRHQPATLTLVPAIVLLVPGSVGFSSLSALLNRDVVPGVESAFRTVLISVALATGLLIADVLVPVGRRSRGSP
jgi:uncharacterized membrane protein YjjB (DUF3815 family)